MIPQFVLGFTVRTELDNFEDSAAEISSNYATLFLIKLQYFFAEKFVVFGCSERESVFSKYSPRYKGMSIFPIFQRFLFEEVLNLRCVWLCIVLVITRRGRKQRHRPSPRETTKRVGVLSKGEVEGDKSGHGLEVLPSSITRRLSGCFTNYQEIFKGWYMFNNVFWMFKYVGAANNW